MVAFPYADSIGRRPRLLPLLLAAGLAGLLSACNSVPALRLAPGPGWIAYWNVWELTVRPSETDPEITRWNAPHLIYIPADENTPPRNLFVFLPGTHGTPSGYSDFLKAAARHGQHVIGLSYPNEQAVRPVCNGSLDRDCHGDLRREVILGGDTSPYVQVDRRNSIENRLVRLLQLLHHKYPEQDWGRYFDAETALPRWDRIAVSGYSQGAGHAAFIAHNVKVLKAGLYSGPGDVNAPLGDQVARWMEGPSRTPADRIAGFTHADDEIAVLNLVRSNWQALGLSGEPVYVDRRAKTAAAEAISRQFVTRLPAALADDYANHAATVRDAYVPRDARQLPLFLKVWTLVSWP